MIVYILTNTVNGKKYVGATTRTKRERMGEHLYETRRGRSDNPLYEDMRRYGFEKFDFRVLSVALNKEALAALEIFWTRELCTRSPNGYNLTDGGVGTLGMKHSAEVRAEITARNLGRKDTPATRAKRSESAIGNTNARGNRGKSKSAEWRAKMSASLIGNTRGLGRKMSPESRAKLSAAKKTALVKVSPEEKRARAMRSAETRRRNAA